VMPETEELLIPKPVWFGNNLAVPESIGMNATIVKGVIVGPVRMFPALQSHSAQICSQRLRALISLSDTFEPKDKPRCLRGRLHASQRWKHPARGNWRGLGCGHDENYFHFGCARAFPCVSKAVSRAPWRLAVPVM